MGRRRRSNAENFIDLVALLPWYVGIVLAIASFFLLSAVAGSGAGATVRPAAVIWHTFASIGRIVVPLFCLVGAALSAWRRHERRSLVQQVTSSPAADSLNAMGWRQFEKLVGEGFRLQGYRVVENETAGPDGGVDLVLRKDGEKYLVQCKQWRSVKVGVPVVRELLGAMTAMNAVGGIVVTSGQFTPEAQAFAKGRNLQLLDGTALHGLIRQARTSAANQDSRPLNQAAFKEPATSAQACPVCSRTMVRRTAKKGSNAGTEFWGCPDFPRCRGTA